MPVPAPSPSRGSDSRLGHHVTMDCLKECKASSGLPCSTLRLASTCTPCLLVFNLLRQARHPLL